MKITLDIPDETKAMLVKYIYWDGFSYDISAHRADEDDLFDGAEILVRPKEEQEGKR